MANMSYCMYSNTLQDLRQCYEDMDQIPSSEEEKEARTKLIKLCADIAEAFNED